MSPSPRGPGATPPCLKKDVKHGGGSEERGIQHTGINTQDKRSIGTKLISLLMITRHTAKKQTFCLCTSICSNSETEISHLVNELVEYVNFSILM